MTTAYPSNRVVQNCRPDPRVGCSDWSNDWERSTTAKMNCAIILGEISDTFFAGQLQ
jgi:hypothetical protein